MSRAEQFVLFDAMFTYTKQQADTSTPSKSHYYVRGPMLNPMRPTNWLSPVDYRNGTVHIRTEVIDKPAGSEVTQWVLCYIANQGGYGCAGTGTYREEGLYEKDESMTSWWNNQTIMWQAGIKQMDLVMKDSNGSTGFAHLRPDAEKFFPTTMRITMIQVSAGSKYDPSLVPNIPARPADGGTSDAATTPDGGAGDTAGAGGSGGTTGTGGSSGGTGGATGTGGSSATGGSSGATGGTAGATTGSGGATTSTGGAPGASNGDVTAGCSVAGAPIAAGTAPVFLLLAFALRRRRAHRAQ